jgi:hypothetical protein
MSDRQHNEMSLMLYEAVALPNQTIRTEEQVAEQGVPTTRRRLTYDDLLVHLRHYSPGTRKGIQLVVLASMLSLIVESD